MMIVGQPTSQSVSIWRVRIETQKSTFLQVSTLTCSYVFYFCLFIVIILWLQDQIHKYTTSSGASELLYVDE